MIMRLSIVVPCYNEEPVLQETTVRLSAVLDSLVEKRKYRLTVLFCTLMMEAGIRLGRL